MKEDQKMISFLTKTISPLRNALINNSSLHFWPSFTTEDYWPSAVLNLVNT